MEFEDTTLFLEDVHGDKNLIRDQVGQLPQHPCKLELQTLPKSRNTGLGESGAFP
jgi:hypothetical protein